MLRTEELRPGFTKYHVNRDGEEGWPWRPVLHRIWLPDRLPHDHPGNLTATVVRGPGYIEELYVLTRGGLIPAGTIQRRLGDRFEVAGETIHRIVDTLGGETWTLVEHEPNRRVWQVFEVPVVR